MMLGTMYKTGGGRMMDGWDGQGLVAVGGVLHLVTWVALIALLWAVARFFWKKGDKVK